MGTEIQMGVELSVKLAPSEEWVAAAKEQARASGISLELTCPREERVAEVHLRAVLVVPLATVPKEQWPAFRVDMGQVMLRGKDGQPVPATMKLLDLEQRALTKAKETHPQLASMVMRALAEAT